MMGPLKCGWGCGSSFYNDDEQQAHEKACHKRPANERSTASQASGAGAPPRGSRAA
jgi:hypothetical protein